MLKFAWTRRAACVLILVLGAGAVLHAPQVSAAPRAKRVLVHTVQPGEWLSLVAKSTHTTSTAIIRANHLKTRLIWPGQRLRLPTGAVAGPRPIYVVRRKDTLAAIIRRTHSLAREVVRLNRLRSSRVFVGMRLLLPYGAVLPVGQLSPLLLKKQVPIKAVTKPVKRTPAAKPKILVYRIVSGDSLSMIATRTGCKLAALLALNHLKETALIVPGQLLRLPAGSHLPKARPTSRVVPARPTTPRTPVVTGKVKTYVVHKGETLPGIAARAHVALATLRKLNGLPTQVLLSPGRALRLPVGASNPRPNPIRAIKMGSRSAALTRLMGFVRAQLGKPYSYFTAGPDTYDCSGLSMAAYETVGIYLPHQSLLQSQYGTAVNWQTGAIAPGDLVFTMSSHGLAPIGHVSIAVNSKQIIHAPRTGDVVKYAKMPADTKIVTVKRYIP